MKLCEDLDVHCWEGDKSLKAVCISTLELNNCVVVSLSLHWGTTTQLEFCFYQHLNSIHVGKRQLRLFDTCMTNLHWIVSSILIKSSFQKLCSLMTVCLFSAIRGRCKQWWIRSRHSPKTDRRETEWSPVPATTVATSYSQQGDLRTCKQVYKMYSSVLSWLFFVISWSGLENVWLIQSGSLPL